MHLFRYLCAALGKKKEGLNIQETYLQRERLTVKTKHLALFKLFIYYIYKLSLL